MKNKQRGTLGENAVAEYLQREGYRILARNYRYQRAEIDLIAKKGNQISFVEVKTRSSNRFGTPAEAVTPAKRANIIRGEQGYLAEFSPQGCTYSFDVAEVLMMNGQAEIHYIQNAFTL